MKSYTTGGVLGDVKRLVFIPFNQHSAIAVHSYLATDPDFVKYAKEEPERLFPLDKGSDTLKKRQLKLNGTLFVSYVPGEDIATCSIEHAKRHPHVEGIGTTDFWLDTIYSGKWPGIKEQDMDPRKITTKLLKNGEYSFSLNGYRIHWQVLESDYPTDVAKFAVLGDKGSSLNEYRNLGEIAHVGEKRLIHFGKRAVELTFPGQKIITKEVTRGSERFTKFMLDQGIPTVDSDLLQSGKSAESAGLKIFEDFGIQPLVKSTVINGNGPVIVSVEGISTRKRRNYAEVV